MTPSHSNRHVRVVALGNAAARDDGVALLVAERLAVMRADLSVCSAGRPGVGMLDLVDENRPTLLLDAVFAGLQPGELVCMTLDEVTHRTHPRKVVSGHDFGPGEVLRLAVTLGRCLPPGLLLGVQVERIDPGFGLSARLAARFDEIVERALVEADALARRLGRWESPLVKDEP